MQIKTRTFSADGEMCLSHAAVSGLLAARVAAQSNVFLAFVAKSITNIE